MKADFFRWLFVGAMAALLIAGFACAGDDDDDDASDDDDDDTDDGPVDSNERDNPAVALVITTDAMQGAWLRFADWKDRTGMRTDVVLIEDILSGKSEADAQALRDYLKTAFSQGVRYVLLGGDADQIPYIRGYTEVWAGETFNGTAPIQNFFEELDGDWDADGDGVYAEQGEDITLEDLRDPEIAVGRVPVETEEEALGFVNKVLRYEAGAGLVAERATCPLFLGDVAASVPLVGDIDGGIMHEQLIADYFPDAFKANKRRLYGTEFYANLVGAEVGTYEKVMNAFEDEGYPFCVTNTHGNFYYLTNLMYRDNVMEMTNEVPFVFVTTSCLSGNFADRSTSNGDNPLQTGSDSVAEELVKNPDGGAVAYIGNTLIGLGPLGGVQFNHSICRAIFQEGDAILGDAMLTARRTLWSEVAYVKVGDLTVEFSMDMDLFPGAEWFTLRSIIMLGDPMLRVWTQQPTVLTLSGAQTFQEGYNALDAQVLSDGKPAAGITVTLDQVGGVLVSKTSDADGNVQFGVQLDSGDTVLVTAWAPNAVAAEVELDEQYEGTTP